MNQNFLSSLGDIPVATNFLGFGESSFTTIFLTSGCEISFVDIISSDTFFDLFFEFRILLRFSNLIQRNYLNGF
jgi:hypothetical protein